MKKLNLIIALLLIFCSFSCKKYLEEAPKIQTDIKTADQLDALINNATVFAYDGDNPTAAYSTDDTEIPLEVYKAYSSAFDPPSLYHYVFDVNNVAAQPEAVYKFWATEYAKILKANLILANIDKVSGTEIQKRRIKADAYFIRAYAYWNLANYYCLPYSTANMQALGLPLKTTVVYDESLKRATLQETYELIQSDLAKALEFVPAGDVVANLRWRISKPAIDAFLSRFYLFIGDYQKSLQHADLALTSANAQLVDFNTIGPGTAATYGNPSVTLRYSKLNDWFADSFLYWNEFYYTRLTTIGTQWFIPSENLRSLYDTSNDLRYQLFMIPQGSRRFFVVTPSAFRYTVFEDGYSLPSGPTRSEVLLNKAEAAARLGDATTALTTINLLRAKRLKTFDGITAANAPEALTKILLERRRELPFSFRWWDIRRFSVNTDATDDVVVTRKFYKLTSSGTFDINTLENYSLPSRSSRYQVPIAISEINTSRGQLEQNHY